MKSRTIGAGIFVLLLTLLLASTASAKPSECVTIQDGTLDYSDGHYLNGEGLSTGYDTFGYNYQASRFRGTYANVYLGRDGFPPYGGDDAAYAQRLTDEGYGTSNPYGQWYWPYRDANVQIEWNDDWLSNKDCDDDGALDRHLNLPTYIGSGAWETNHQSGTYEFDGKTCRWIYFVKIVAVPADADLVDGIWYTAEGSEIGPVIWGEFATIQSVYNDPCDGYHGVEYLSPSGPGFGKWD